ncbi:MAG: hypothetical protein NC126_10570, partial [Clostridium sp.]|nr:hypothetical protein [Clostridium sp.]
GFIKKNRKSANEYLTQSFGLFMMTKYVALWYNDSATAEFKSACAALSPLRGALYRYLLKEDPEWKGK